MEPFCQIHRGKVPDAPFQAGSIQKQGLLSNVCCAHVQIIASCEVCGSGQPLALNELV